MIGQLFCLLMFDVFFLFLAYNNAALFVIRNQDVKKLPLRKNAAGFQEVTICKSPPSNKTLPRNCERHTEKQGAIKLVLVCANLFGGFYRRVHGC